MKSDLSETEKAVLRKLITKPLAGFEFDPKERQTVQRLVHEGLIEDHGHAFKKVWPTKYCATRAWELGIFRLGVKARALMINGGLGAMTLIAILSTPALAAEPAAQPAATPEQILSQLLRQRADNCEQNLATQAALGAAAQQQVAELKKQIADLEAQLKAMRPSGPAAPVTTAPHKTDPSQSPSNQPHPAK